LNLINIDESSFFVNFAPEPVGGGRRVGYGGGTAPGRQGDSGRDSGVTALISIHGAVHIASEASLAGLLPVVEGRLRELARKIDFNQY